MDYELSKIFDLIFGPSGGLFALGVMIGVKISWKFFDSRTTQSYQDNIKTIKTSAAEVKEYLTTELHKVRDEMRAQDETCKRDLRELQEKIYTLMSEK